MCEPAPSPGACEFCGGEQREAFATTDRNRACSDIRFTYLRCVRCGTYSLRNVPADLGLYYPDDYYASEERDALERAASAPPEQAKLAMISAHVSAGRLVEIGPGGGQFSLAASNAGFLVSAVEMDQQACERIERVLGIPVLQSSQPETALAQLPPSDVVAMWHVLEHLERPALTIERIAENLRPGGVLALAVPNPQSLQFRLLGGRWAHVDAPRHIFLVPLDALAEYASGHGLELVSSTTADPAGRYWNWFGWEYALRRFPAKHPTTRLTRALAAVLARVVSPLERRALAGSTYTAVFVKRA